MQYHIISDDNYFLLGAKKFLADLNKEITYSQAEMVLNKFISRNNDIVILKIKNVFLREKIFLQPKIKCCRLIILMEENTIERRVENDCFPWVAADNISGSSLLAILEKAESSPFVKNNVTELECLLFQYLVEGYRFSWMEKWFGLERKYLYLQKQRTLKRYGIRIGHPGGVLIFRDITKVCPLVI